MSEVAYRPQPIAPAAPSRAGSTRRVGWGITIFVSTFLIFDGGARLIGFAPYVEGTAAVGFPVHLGPWIGLALVVSTLLYVAPWTAVLGAILVTGYLGGATAAQARLEDPWFLFPVGFGVLTWLGIYLRDDRLRELLPLRR